MLHGIGAKVYVAVRKYSDLAWIEANGYTPIIMSDFSVWLNKFDVIFNTVPHVILDAKELQNIKMNALIVDLASKPGGINNVW
ncbi:MAG: hypothetical protein ACM3KR_02400 [Deltaproteobacteria bacterium]